MKILVVEDEHRIANYIKKGLEMKSHVVDVVYDGDDGYDMASEEQYDVIVLDRMLPGMNGVEICQRLRKEGKHTPVLMLTARAEVDDRVEGLEAGADDYLGKPFAFSEMLARIKALSRRPREAESAVLEVGDLTLDTNSYRVARAGCEIKLSRKEFALLEFMMRHTGQIFTKEQLTEQVWPYDSDVLPNTAQVYLGYLRSKIDKPFPDKPKLINTVRGFGYRFE